MSAMEPGLGLGTQMDANLVGNCNRHLLLDAGNIPQIALILSSPHVGGVSTAH